jgi:hypothetical protein
MRRLAGDHLFGRQGHAADGAGDQAGQCGPESVVRKMISDLLRSIGIDPSFLAAGAAGGLLRSITRKKIRLREIIVSPIAGMLACVYLTVPIVQYLQLMGWPMPENNFHVYLASSFLVGNSAMWASDLLFGAIAKWFGVAREPPSQ